MVLLTLMKTEANCRKIIWILQTTSEPICNQFLEFKCYYEIQEDKGRNNAETRGAIC